MLNEIKEVGLDDEFKEIRAAYNECVNAKISAYEIAKKHAHLCVEVVRWHIREFEHPPELINGMMEKQKIATDGLSPLSEEFWFSPDMVIALYEYLENEFGLWEDKHAST